MLFIVGAIVVILSVIGGYMANGGHVAVLWQPFEFVIIGGAAIGAFLIANPKSLLSRIGGALGSMLKGSRYDRAAYLELLTLQYSPFKLAKSKGLLALESHVEKPHESSIFQKFPIFLSDHHAVTLSMRLPPAADLGHRQSA